ncbi:hypothetical protein FRB99_008960 [Tulasnella sp. 403]|nr:hypothetical protein FRB99_008960 [Tulasnella sp. 403]
MQDPRTEIIDVVKRFTTTDKVMTGGPNCDRYFTPDAAFDHPLAKVKSGSTSRADIIALYQWYKIASPKIDLEVESVAFDEVTGTMFLTVM